MAMYLAEAYLAENGTVNGKKGDQANEIRLSTPYMHRLGWKVFRHPDAEIAKWIGINARVIAQNQNFGYGWNDRTSGYNACVNAGWEPALVNEPCNLDCSEKVRTCVACALEKHIPDFNTASEPRVLLSLGFIEVTDGSRQHGDIWCTPVQGHTAILCDTSIVGTSSTPQSNAVTSAGAPDIIYRAKAGGRWLPEVKNDEDYAGIEDVAMTAFMARRADGGVIRYRASVVGNNNFYPWVTGYDVNDYNNGYVGDGKNALDEIEIKVDGYTYVYKTSPVGTSAYYAEVSDDTTSGSDSYAGANNKPIDKISIRKG